MAHAFADKEYHSETQELAADAVEQISRMLSKAFPGCRPRTLFTDRGPGFYHSRWGTVTADYSAAVTNAGLDLWAGSSAARRSRAAGRHRRRVASRGCEQLAAHPLGQSCRSRAQAVGGDAGRLREALGAVRPRRERHLRCGRSVRRFPRAAPEA